ncbi:MAG: sigma 54-interacting transcriptional regulator [Candidatus Moduliflexus flocculans]|nr:sigma 54-interacting transcriptional regulator [Candidatus Moduliflexus flocculans]
MTDVFATIDKVARTEANILILGENGTGKELAAREIHRRSQRHQEVFVGVDMSAIPETLFESELFGHVKGAFTDAREDRAGRFEAASGGTLFLDEIGNLPLPLQAKILTVAGEPPGRPGRVEQADRPSTSGSSARPTGPSTRWSPRTSSARTSSTGSTPSRSACRPSASGGRTSPCSSSTSWPPTAASTAGRSRPPARPRCSSSEGYAWPGNVRELQHAVERAVIMSDAAGPASPPTSSSAPRRAPPRRPRPPRLSLEDLERRHVERVLSKHGGNVSQAARELGISRAALYRRLEKHGL